MICALKNELKTISALLFMFSGLSLLSETLGPKREQREGWLWSCFGWGAVYSGGLSMLGVVGLCFIILMLNNCAPSCLSSKLMLFQVVFVFWILQ